MSNYPLKVLSMGAGVQSTTLLYMMLRGEIEKADHVIFADTGWEPQTVYDHLEKLKVLMVEANMPFHFVTAKRAATKEGSRNITGNLRKDFLEDGSGFASMPLHILQEDGKHGMIKRQCTFDYKIQPVLLKMRELAGLKRGERCKEIRIIQMFGISYDESQRMRDPSFSWIQNFHTVSIQSPA
jgi:3'-phosphoadenosine 5'-phosphosulfate sulfotransferase (PAPS reductase)/FAD synthetase